MSKLDLNPQNINRAYAGNNTQSTCTCYGCGACLACIVFAPVVGAFLFITLGITTDVKMGPSN